MRNRQFLFAIKCKLCKKEFVYCINAGKDVRCYDCKNKAFKEVEKELEEMSQEEYESFMQDIEEFEDELEKKRASRLERKKSR